MTEETPEDFRKKADEIIKKYTEPIEEAIKNCDALDLCASYGNLSGDFGELRQKALEVPPGNLGEIMSDISSKHMEGFRKMLKFGVRCRCKEME